MGRRVCQHLAGVGWKRDSFPELAKHARSAGILQYQPWDAPAEYLLRLHKDYRRRHDRRGLVGRNLHGRACDRRRGRNRCSRMATLAHGSEPLQPKHALTPPGGPRVQSIVADLRCSWSSRAHPRERPVGDCHHARGTLRQRTGGCERRHERRREQ